MIDFRFIIRKALLSSPIITEWVAKVGGNLPNISVNTVTNAVYPLIIYREVSTEDFGTSDDEVDVYETRWEVSLFTKTGTVSKVKSEVDRVMHRVGFILYNSYEFFDDSTKVVHIILKYKQTLDIETFESLSNGSLSF